MDASSQQVLLEARSGSLSSCRDMFSSKEPPEPALLQGVYQAAFVGPAWLRLSAGPSLALLGLRGWWGKEFDGAGGAINLVSRGTDLVDKYSMRVESAVSLIDHKDSVRLSYPSSNPFPWPWVIDELRQIDQDHLLGMTIVNLAWLRRIAFPFLLRRRQDMDVSRSIG